MPALLDPSQGYPLDWLIVAAALLGELLAIVFVARILMRGGAPASTLLWVVVILLTPWLGLLLYYLFPRRLQLRRLRRLRARQELWRGSLRPARHEETRATAPGPGPAADNDVMRLLRGVAPECVSGGNEVRWLPEASDFAVAADEAIAAAQRFVHLEVYIFRPDAAGLHLLAALSAAAQRGVAVRLLFDSIGSFGLKAPHLAALRAAGGRAEPFLPLLWKRRPFTVNLRNHRKLLVVDGEIAFVGGRNVGDEYLTGRLGARTAWHDAMAAVRGPAVADLHHVFAEDWFNATDEELTDPLWFPPQPPCGDDMVGVVASGPDRTVPELWYAVFQAVSVARSSIDISSPYLVPPPTLLFALQVAAARGVRVRIFTNGPAAEAFLLYHAQRSYYDELVASGIEVHETAADYNHTKVLVIDGRTVVVGSANLDLRSAHFNFEIAIVLPDSPALAGAVTATLDHRCTTCAPVAPTARGPWQRLLDGACRLVSPLL